MRSLPQEDGGVSKKVLKEGTGYEMPDKGDEVFGECAALCVCPSSLM